MRLLILLSSLTLVACANTGAHEVSSKHIPPYCQTDQTIVKNNNDTVSSETILTCSDDPVKKLLPPKMGVADHCKEYYYDVVLNGKIVERRGFACLMKGKDYESSRWYIIADPY